MQDFLDHMSYLQLANNWSNDQLCGETIVALASPALSWFHDEVDLATLKTDGKFTYEKLSTAHKARFTSAFSESDLLEEVVACKQSVGQSVDDFLTIIMPKMAKLQLSEEMKCGLLIQNFVTPLKKELMLKDLKTLNSVEHWAVKLQRMVLTHKTSTSSVAVVENDFADLLWFHVSQAPNQVVMLPTEGDKVVLKGDVVEVN